MRSTSIRMLLLSSLLGVCIPLFAQKAPTVEEARRRLQVAEAMFEERCKKAGEKIYRTVDNVDGILLMKIRPDKVNYDDQFSMDDPYGHDSGGETYIKIFFTGFYRTPLNPPVGWKPRLGYRYIETIDPKDGKRYRYTGRIDEPWQRDKSYLKGYTRFVLDRTAVSGSIPRFGVTYDDISTHEERKYWIAGSSLKVIDLKTNEVIAERVGYMMDREQGNTSGGRAPWLLAANHACPAFSKDPGGHTYQTDQTHDFVVKTLKPKLEN